MFDMCRFAFKYMRLGLVFASQHSTTGVWYSKRAAWYTDRKWKDYYKIQVIKMAWGAWGLGAWGPGGHGAQGAGVYGAP